MVFLADITDETTPQVISNYHVPEPSGQFCSRGGRFGAHSSNENMTPIYYRKVVFVSYFNAGVRAVDIRDPFAPKEVGFYIPEVTENTDPRCITVNGMKIESATRATISSVVLSGFPSHPGTINAVTVANVKEMFTKYFPMDRYTIVTLVPEK